MQKPIFVISLIHFLLLSGYKLFSFYYPLFLSSKGFSFSLVGLNYFILYFCVGFFSLLFFFLKKGNIKYLLTASVFGYAFYSISMLFISGLFQFLLMQALLGFSSAMFYVSAREAILLKTKAKIKDFQYFYLAPLVSSILVPIVGGILIYFGSFALAFLSSTIIYFLTLIQIPKLGKISFPEKKIKFKLKNKRILLFSFAIMAVFGFYRAFFILFLKNIGLKTNQIIMFIFFANLILFFPLFISSKRIDNYNIESLFFYFSILYAITTILLGFTKSLYLIFILYLCEFSLSILLKAEKSFLLKDVEALKKERSIIDTAIESFGVALGALLSGFLSIYFSISNIFIIFGFCLFVFALIFGKFTPNN